MAAKIEALTFDWYGTLEIIATDGAWKPLFGISCFTWSSVGFLGSPRLYKVFQYYGAMYKPELSDKGKRIFWIQFTMLLFEQLQVNGTTANQNEVHATAMRDIFGSGCFELYVDVQPVLGALKRRGLRLAVVLNWHRGLDSFCHETNLSSLLDAVISSSDLGIEKPTPHF